MEKITLTLTVDIVTAQKVLDYLATHESNVEAPRAANNTKRDTLVANALKVATEAKNPANNISIKVPPTAGKKTSMPSFGRSKEQIETYVKQEEARVEALDEEAELKAQKAADRAAKKALRDEEEAVKNLQAEKLAKEIEDIKSSETPIKPSTMPKKPWEL